MSLRPMVAFGAAIAAVVLIVADLEARPSGGSSSGSRGSRTFSAPPATKTAPTTAAPIQRTVTQPAAPTTAAGQAQARPPAASPGFFNRPGLLGGLAAGFLGAGLIGMLMGNGLLGGLGGIASMLGLMLQIAVVAGVALLIWKWWQRRQGLATAGGPSLRDNVSALREQGPVENSNNRPSMLGGLGLGALGGGGGNGAFAKVAIGPKDYDDFERLLSEVSLAYGAEDREKLRTLVTPEMHGYFSEQIDDSVNRGLANKISGLQLLQGDLAEAWREDDAEYATVAMKYSIVDATVERTTGRVVEGSTTPQEVTELWTFLRMRGSGWVLSAIQQT
jgi:predicted lipid-binding transport protein (Tim44 family)